MKYILLFFIVFTPMWGQNKGLTHNKNIELIDNPILYGYIGSKIHTLKLKQSSVVSKPILHINQIKSEILPKNDLNYSSRLILPKGIYTFNGIRYDLREEGLHRILDLANDDSLQVIIYENDILKLLSSFSWMVKHGNINDRDTFLSIRKLMRKENLSLTCGPISNYVHTYLKRLGIKSRLIHFFKKNNFNTYDNGHILLEVRIDKKWILVDIDNNVIFIDKNKGFLSAYDIATQKDAFKKQVKLSSDVGGVLNFKSQKSLLNFSFYMDNFTLNQWYASIMQVLFIYDKGKFPLCTDNMNWKEITQYYRYTKCLDKQAFYRQNYGDK